MGKRRSPILAKVSNLIKVSVFFAKMRLVYLKKSTKFRSSLKHYNSYGWLQQHQFSPSATPLIRFHRRKTNGVYSLCFLPCFGGRHDHRGADNESYISFESAIVEAEGDRSELAYGEEEEEEEDDDNYSVDERAERFIERFYEEMKRQRRESSSANFPLNRLLEY